MIVFHPTAEKFSSVAYGTFSKLGHILCHNASLNKYKKVKIISCILTDHYGIKLETNSKKDYKHFQICPGSMKKLRKKFKFKWK
jgi:hypothetical protein